MAYGTKGEVDEFYKAIGVYDLQKEYEKKLEDFQSKDPLNMDFDTRAAAR